jgi:hypothetical protein
MNTRNNNRSIALIDEYSCPSKAITYAQGAGASNVKAIQPKGPKQLEETIEEAKDYDVIIMDCKLFLTNSDWPCFSTEEVDGLKMSAAAAAIYSALKEMGKTVIGVSADSTEQECSIEMLNVTKKIIEPEN